MPEEDTLTRKFNSLIRSLGSPETPSSGQSPQNAILQGILSRRSPVKPLVPRRAEGVARHKPKSQRYSPLKSSCRKTPYAQSPSRRKPRDSKTLYKVSSIRDLRALSPSHVSQEKVASPAEYIPAVNRLSAIITNYEENKGRPIVVANDLNVSNVSYSSLQHRLTGAQFTPKTATIGEFAQMSSQASFIDGKENRSTRSSTKNVPFSRSDTAKQRTRLMQSQRLPTVVIRPASGGSFQAFPYEGGDMI